MSIVREWKRLCVGLTLFGVALVSGACCSVPKEEQDIEDVLSAVLAESDGLCGVAVKWVGDSKVYGVNMDKALPLASVYKFHLGLSVFDRVDQGKLRLDQKLKVKPSDLALDTWSPLRDQYPKGGDFTVEDLVAYTVAQSDNSTCDFLFGVLGGPEVVDKDMKAWKQLNTKIYSTEKAVFYDRSLQYKNVASARDLVLLLEKFDQGEVLKPKTRDALWTIMKGTTTGVNRIKSDLPKGTVFAHKTGTGYTDKTTGNCVSTNDIGIIVMPNGKHLALAVLLSDSKASEPDREAVVARLGKKIYDHFAGQSVAKPAESAR